MIDSLLVEPEETKLWRNQACAAGTRNELIQIRADDLRRLLIDADAARELFNEINNPHTCQFLVGLQNESAHQRQRWGQPADRGKSAENWFWLVGYLAGKCLRAAITGDREKAKHHTISAAAALANWFEAIDRDTTGTGEGHDADIKPIELTRFEVVGGASTEDFRPAINRVERAADLYSGR